MTGQRISDATDTEWLDTMVSRLKAELERQLAAVSMAAGQGVTPASRAADARTLNSLERTLERLARLEQERAARQERKVARHDKSARAALERRLDKLAAANETKRDSGGAEPG
jgi:hypothetical protein